MADGRIVILYTYEGKTVVLFEQDDITDYEMNLDNDHVVVAVRPTEPVVAALMGQHVSLDLRLAKRLR